MWRGLSPIRTEFDRFAEAGHQSQTVSGGIRSQGRIHQSLETRAVVSHISSGLLDHLGDLHHRHDSGVVRHVGHHLAGER